MSPDSRYVLTGSTDKTARLWDVAEQRTLRVLEGHEENVAQVAFSPDGKRLLTGSIHRLAVWETRSGRLLYAFDQQSSFCGAFAPDGRHVLSASREGAILHDVATGRIVRKYGDHGMHVRVACFTPGGEKLLLLQAVRPMATLWDVATGRKERSPLWFDRHLSSAVLALAFSPDGRKLLKGGGHTYGSDPAVLIDATTGDVLHTFGPATGCALAYSPDGRYVVTAAPHNAPKKRAGQLAVLWDAATGELLRTLDRHKDRVITVAFGPRGRHVLTGSCDCTAIVWDAATGQKIVTLGGDENGATFAAKPAIPTTELRASKSSSGKIQETTPVTREKVVAASATWDIDSRGTPDLWWTHINDQERYLKPQGLTEIAIIGGKSFEDLTLSDLEKAEFSKTPLEASDGQSVIDVGTVLAIRTDERNFAKLEVTGFENLHSTPKYHIKLRYVVYSE